MISCDEKADYSSSSGRISKPIDYDEDNKIINLRTLYFRWLIGKLDKKMVKKYSSLLLHLFRNSFSENESVPMDVNRARDGIALRKRFISETPYFGDSELELIKYEECSWLEMIIALAERIDDQMMFDLNLGNRTNQWFWLIIEQMRLDIFDENHYDYNKIKGVLRELELRKYKNDGKDGIFRCQKDVRNVEIWYQMMEWFNENSPKVEF